MCRTSFMWSGQITLIVTALTWAVYYVCIWGHQEFATNFPCNLPLVNYVLALGCLKMKHLPIY